MLSPRDVDSARLWVTVPNPSVHGCLGSLCEPVDLQARDVRAANAHPDAGGADAHGGIDAAVSHSPDLDLTVLDMVVLQPVTRLQDGGGCPLEFLIVSCGSACVRNDLFNSIAHSCIHQSTL